MTFRTNFLIIIIFLGIGLKAQKYVGVNVDNDLYFGSDRYYSSGIFIEFGKLLKKSSDSIFKFNYVSKHWVIGQEINTPALHYTENISNMDYPYNGWLFLGFKKELFRTPDLGYGWGIQFGKTGAEASLAKFFQNTYHKYIINAKELTWAFSIPEAFQLNANVSFFWGKSIHNKIKLVNKSEIQAGSFRTSIKSRSGIQFGSIPGIIFFGNRFEDIKNGISFFLGMELEYNLHDYSLSGSLFRQTSPFNLVAEKTRNNYQGGLIYFRLPWKAHLMFNNSSRFIKTQKYRRHHFLKISLTHIF